MEKEKNTQNKPKKPNKKELIGGYTRAEYAAALREGKSAEEIATDYIKRYRVGYVEKIYPPEAMMLNTTLMINRIGVEFGIV